MADFPIKRYMAPDPDVPGRLKQVMPQNNIDAVIGLQDKLQEIDNVLFQITGKHYTGDKTPEFLTKGDLEKYAKKSDVEDALTGAKKYTDDSLSELAKNLLVKANQYTDYSVLNLKDDYNAKINNVKDNVLMEKTLPSTDLNNVTDSGIYRISYGYNTHLQNGPWKGNNDSGLLIVDKAADNNYIQIFISAINTGAVLIRDKAGYPSGWTQWVLASAQGN